MVAFGDWSGVGEADLAGRGQGAVGLAGLLAKQPAPLGGL
jgi:hypothetical protein